MSVSGIAELPLHTGSVPRWLINRMNRLAKAILTIFVEEFGVEKFLERISNPLWFQAFSNVLGFDWHSSGSTTVTIGVLREVLNRNDFGLMIAGGKGKRGMATPNEIMRIVERFDLGEDYGGKLAEISRLIAKVDNAAIQDGYSIYHHSMIISKNGSWAVVQQGMNVNVGFARRYHWLSFEIESFIEEPHKAIVDVKRIRNVLNLTSRESRGCREVILDLVRNEDRLKRCLGEVKRSLDKSHSILEWTSIGVPDNVRENIVYYKPIEEVRVNWIALKRVFRVKPEDFKDLLLFRGVGPATLRALALISELIYDEPPSKNDPVTHIYDPVKWSFTVGGKDGIPYPINRRVYDNVIFELERIISAIKVKEKEKLRAFRRLKIISEKWNVKL